MKSNRYKYIPPHQLKKKHIGKSMKIHLKNKKVLYGSIKEIRTDGILFLPKQKRSNKIRTQFFWPILIVPIFIPFGFFFPFLCR